MAAVGVVVGALEVGLQADSDNSMARQALAIATPQ